MLIDDKVQLDFKTATWDSKEFNNVHRKQFLTPEIP